MKKILAVLGTRPEGVKMAPVIRALRETNWAKVTVLSTGQHRDLLAGTLSDFGLRSDIDLALMQENQPLATLTARIFAHLDPVLAELNPDLVLAQGDTTTVMGAAVSCFYRRIAFGHIEAGLRSGNLEHPFPEEFNRIVAGRVATIHFAPTPAAKQNLLAEGIRASAIKVTGNTVIDALISTAEKISEAKIEGSNFLLVVTAHRRENFGEPFLRICRALRKLHDDFPDLNIVYPVHPNPYVLSVARNELGSLPRVRLIPPVGYREMVALLKRSFFVITDSGGLQEEAPALGKPVLVVRDVTERPEAVAAGVVKVVGTDDALIVSEASRLLSDKAHYKRMSRGISPYGDGRASGRIVEAVHALLGGRPEELSAIPDWEPNYSTEQLP